ncbi:MAG: hypothetical protein MMC33_005735 [Icmadophila ericetorum]|nr:hypothetical protein [Icmadophila ericetorum]
MAPPTNGCIFNTILFIAVYLYIRNLHNQTVNRLLTTCETSLTLNKTLNADLLQERKAHTALKHKAATWDAHFHAQVDENRKWSAEVAEKHGRIVELLVREIGKPKACERHGASCEECEGGVRTAPSVEGVLAELRKLGPLAWNERFEEMIRVGVKGGGGGGGSTAAGEEERDSS